MEPKKHVGSCHCKAVRFEVEVDASAGNGCNCSLCTKLGGIGALVKPAAFALLEGETQLGFYEWGAKTGRHFHCKSCGVYCFTRGHLVEVGGDYVSVNLRCLDDIDVSEVKLTYWDGRHNNWEAGPRSTPWPVSASPATAAAE